MATTRTFVLTGWTPGSTTVQYKVDADPEGATVLVPLTTLPYDATGDEMPDSPGSYFVNVPNWNPSWTGYFLWYDNGVSIEGVVEEFGAGATSTPSVPV